jgi:hypothetical protein
VSAQIAPEFPELLVAVLERKASQFPEISFFATMPFAGMMASLQWQ